MLYIPFYQPLSVPAKKLSRSCRDVSGWPVSFPSCISWFYSPYPFRDPHSCGVLLAAVWKTSANCEFRRESPGPLPGSFRENVKTQNLWQLPKCPAEKELTWTCITSTYSRLRFFHGVDVKFLYGLYLGEIARARESPLTRVELRCHCSRDSTISRFLATVYQVCRHYVASEMENISQRGDIAEGVLNITHAEFSPMPASHKYAKLSLQKYVRTVGVGYSLFSLWLKFNVY